jgi:uncharacterized membrane protein YkvA (DUF1232 family)
VKAGAQFLRQKLRGAEQSDTTDPSTSDPSNTEVDLPSALDALDEEFVEEGARTVTDTDVETVVTEADAIEERFRDNGPLQRLLDDGRLLLDLVRDVKRGNYRRVPLWTLSAAAFALLYVLNPFDVIPDALPVVGVLDDAAVVSACLVLLEQDLYDYRKWRRQKIEDSSESDAASGNG